MTKQGRRVRVMTDKNLIRITKSFRYGILGSGDADLMCYAVSAPLQGYLKAAHELDTRLVSGYLKIETKPGRFMEPEHFWLELEDGRILDPTHDQFGYEEKVYLGKKPSNYFECDK
jgi:hypothetical protein